MVVASISSNSAENNNSSSFKVSYDILEVKMSILNHRGGGGSGTSESHDHGSGTNTGGGATGGGSTNNSVGISSSSSTSNNIYLSIDLSAEIITRLKNLSTHDIEQLRQIGVLSVQFDDDSYRVNIPPLEPPPPPPTSSLSSLNSVLHSNAAQFDSSAASSSSSNTIRTQDFARMDIYQHQQRASSHLVSGSGNETIKKRNRKTISELTSGASFATNSECSNDNELSNGPTTSGNNVNIITSSSSGGGRKAGGPRGPTKRGSSRDMSNGGLIMSGGSSTSSSPYILTSMIVDQSPTGASPLNSQFAYMKQFTMPSPILSNILTDVSSSSSEQSGKDKLMYMDGYRNIYQMRQELASQVGIGGDQGASGIVLGQPPIKKQRKTQQQNKDSDKPRGRRGPKSKGELSNHTETPSLSSSTTASSSVSGIQQSTLSQHHQQQPAYFYQTTQMLNSNSGSYMLNSGTSSVTSNINSNTAESGIKQHGSSGGGGTVVVAPLLPTNLNPTSTNETMSTTNDSHSQLHHQQQQQQQQPSVMFQS